MNCLTCCLLWPAKRFDNSAWAAVLLVVVSLGGGCSDSTGTEVRRARIDDAFTDIYDRSGSSDASCDDQQQTVQSGAAILAEYCSSCHAGGQSPGGVGPITDVAGLVARGYIVPGDAQASAVFTMTYQDLMPPQGSPRPSQSEVEAIAKWIDAMDANAQQTLAQDACDGGAGQDGPLAPKGGEGVTVEATLQKHCFSCHGANGVSAGKVGNILDREELVANGMVVPGEPNASPVIIRMQSTQRPMPPANMPRLSDAEIQALVDWVADGAPASNPGGGKPGAPAALVAPEQEFLAALNDLDDIARLSPNDARFKRYLSFAHLENAGLNGSLRENYINSLSRFVNSLSDNRRIVQPRKIQSEATIYRIDIRDYGWSLADWEALVRRYPYAALQQSAARRQSFLALADTAIPLVRADWFVFEASQPEIYHRLLDIPARELALQATVGVNVAQALLDQVDGNGSEAATVMRAGFLNSGVALNNRVLERHDSLFGSFWVSYDFREPNFNNVNDVDASDIFRSPLGPFEELGGRLAFDHDGGEIIFSLPNGLNAYMLVDGVGNRIDVAPSDVVADPDRPEGIINGYSCMTCHAGGLIDKQDEVRGAIRGNAGFNINDRVLIEQLYVDSAQFSGAIKQDNDIYRAALERASITQDGQNHVVIMATQYENDVPLAVVAAEFGLSADEFLLRLQGSDDELRRRMSSLASSLTIDRRVLESLIEQIVLEFFPTPRR